MIGGKSEVRKKCYKGDEVVEKIRNIEVFKFGFDSYYYFGYVVVCFCILSG